jgi:hypothetical protein
MAGTAGVDFRIGLGSALTLTGTVNPDFGQVEVDPAIINLSAVETFLPEKRPFFLEGLGIFQFGGLPVPAALSFSQFVHWRRIGRAPQLSPGAAWIDAPEQATILGAAKVSGQLPGGWSLGIADAVTQREEARMADTGGERGTFVVEPLANYFVGRAKRDFNDGRATVGVLTTATNRSLDGASAASLRSSAYLMGMDASIASSDRRWRADGFFVQARVAGTAEAIASTQRSSVRFLQRPDKDYALYDPTRTSLSGHDASLKVAYQGQPWFGGAEVRETTPGYEANDLGYMSRADTRTATLAFGGIRNNSASLIRSLRVTGSTMSAWNFGGNLLYQRLGVASSAQFSSFWTAAAGVAIRPPLYSDKHTRGGPLVNVAGQWEVSGDIATDSRRKVRGMLSGEFEQQEENGTEGSVSGMVIVRPSPSLQFSATPRLDLLRDEAQYVRTVPDVLAARTYDNRYVFATLRQRTVSVDLRGDWTLTPALSLQLFAQPFVSTARFDGYKELRIPGTFEFDVYGRDAGTVVTQDDGTIEVDPDGAGAAAAFLLGTRSNETSFVTRALRLNAVARWEYRGGSALFLIWQQSRDADGHLDGDYGSGSIGRVLDVPARNTLLVKASYRLGR